MIFRHTLSLPPDGLLKRKPSRLHPTCRPYLVSTTARARRPHPWLASMDAQAWIHACSHGARDKWTDRLIYTATVQHTKRIGELPTPAADPLPPTASMASCPLSSCRAPPRSDVSAAHATAVPLASSTLADAGVGGSVVCRLVSACQERRHREKAHTKSAAAATTSAPSPAVFSQDTR